MLGVVLKHCEQNGYAYPCVSFLLFEVNNSVNYRYTFSVELTAARKQEAENRVLQEAYHNFTEKSFSYKETDFKESM